MKGALLNQSIGCQNHRFLNSGKHLCVPGSRQASSRRQVRVTAFATDEKIISVKFSVPFKADFGDSIKLVGNNPVLGDWNTTTGLLMDWTEGDIWVTSADLPADSEFKIVLCKGDSTVIWEERPNRSLSGVSSQSLTLTWGSTEDYVESPTTINDTIVTPPFSTVEISDVSDDVIEQQDQKTEATSSTFIQTEEEVKEEKEEEVVVNEEPIAIVDENTEVVVEDVAVDEESNGTSLLNNKNDLVTGAVKTAGALALGVAGAAVLSALAIDVADTAILGAVAAAAGGAMLSSSSPSTKKATKKATDEDNDEDVFSTETDSSTETTRITGAGQPGVAIAAGILSAFDAGKSLVKAFDGSIAKESENDAEE